MEEQEIITSKSHSIKNIIYLPEGDWKDPTNYSGTPLYFGHALIKTCHTFGLECRLVQIPEIINTEPLFAFISAILNRNKEHFEKLLSDLSAVQKKAPATKSLLNNLWQIDDWSKTKEPIAHYLETCEHLVNMQVSKQLDSNSVVLAINTMNPPCKVDAPIYYYLDTPLAPFYFDGAHPFVPESNENSDVVQLFRNLEQCAFQRASGFFFFSKFAADLSINTYTDIHFKSLTVGAGINFPEMPRYKYRNFKRPLRLLFVGRDFSIKGGDIILKTAALLDDERFNLTIVTDKRFHQSKQETKKCVNFLAPVDKTALASLYQNHDIFIFPTQFDAFGIAPCEAMAFGMPVLASPVRAIPEILGSSSIFNPYVSNAEDLILALEALDSDWDLMRSIGRKNYLRATECFTWDNVTARIVSSILG